MLAHSCNASIDTQNCLTPKHLRHAQQQAAGAERWQSSKHWWCQVFKIILHREKMRLARSLGLRPLAAGHLPVEDALVEAGVERLDALADDGNRPEAVAEQVQEVDQPACMHKMLHQCLSE